MLYPRHLPHSFKFHCFFKRFRRKKVSRRRVGEGKVYRRKFTRWKNIPELRVSLCKRLIMKFRKSSKSFREIKPVVVALLQQKLREINNNDMKLRNFQRFRAAVNIHGMPWELKIVRRCSLQASWRCCGNEIDTSHLPRMRTAHRSDDAKQHLPCGSDQGLLRLITKWNEKG